MVIIPGFGAFISEYQAAEINNTSDEIKPPSTRLIFNPQIRNNDGLLVGYVAEQTRKSHFEALQKIEKGRDNIIYQLDKGEKVELEDLGTLYYNADNQVEFISESDKNLSRESFGLESVILTEPEQADEITEDLEPKTPETPEKSEDTKQQNEEQKQATEIVETNETDPTTDENTEKTDTVEEQPEEADKAIILLPVSDKQEKAESTVPKKTPEKKTVPAENIAKPKKEKKRKGSWIWMLAVLIPLVAVSVFLLMQKKENGTAPVKNQKQVPLSEIKEEPVIVADSTTKDSTVLVPANDSVVTEPEIVQTDDKNITGTSNRKFYLIGGSFKAEENAEAYIDVLKEKGFEPFKMGKYGNFYILGIGTYNTEKEAVAAKQEFLNKSPDSGIWILEK